MAAQVNQPFAKNWVFTQNNPSENFEAELMDACESSDCYQFFAGQRELAPETGTEHFQGCLVLSKKKRLSWLKTHLLDTAHWEVMRGTPQQAIAYCTKEESRKPGYDPITWGEEPRNRQGKRNDLDAVKALIDAGADEAKITEEHFSSWIRHYRGFREYKRIKVTPRDWKTEVWVVIGPTGTGKSKLAAESEDDRSKLYYKQAHTDWWDGYEGQPTVVMDDFYGWVRYDEMLRLMDRYPQLVQTKGGQVQFLAKRIIITSNTSPPSWYKKISATTAGLSAFNRRVDKWIYQPSIGVSIAASDWNSFEEMFQTYVLPPLPRVE